MAPRRDLTLLRFGTAVLRLAPVGFAGTVASFVGRFIAPYLKGSAALRRNLEVVGVNDASAMADRGIGAYAKYWVDTLRLPNLAHAEIDRRFSFLNYHHILDVQRAQKTPIIVLPHLGSWEWAAAWLGRLEGQHVVAVVEQLEPAEVFEWFKNTREEYGVEVVPLGSNALTALISTVHQNSSIICLVADRDIAGSGVEVEFFGKTATIPAGPALLSVRTGSPLLPVAVYDRGTTRQCVVGAPLWPERHGKLRADVQRITQSVAKELESLISDAPDQWHVLSDLWPSESESDS